METDGHLKTRNTARPTGVVLPVLRSIRNLSVLSFSEVLFRYRAVYFPTCLAAAPFPESRYCVCTAALLRD